MVRVFLLIYFVSIAAFAQGASDENIIYILEPTLPNILRVHGHVPEVRTEMSQISGKLEALGFKVLEQRITFERFDGSRVEIFFSLGQVLPWYLYQAESFGTVKEDIEGRYQSGLNCGDLF